MNKKYEEMADKNLKIKNEKLPYDFKLWLICCLIKVNDFKDAEIIIGAKYGEEKLDLTANKELLITLFEFVEATIAKLVI